MVPVSAEGRGDRRLLVPEGNDGHNESNGSWDGVDPQLKEKDASLKQLLNSTTRECSLSLRLTICVLCTVHHAIVYTSATNSTHGGSKGAIIRSMCCKLNCSILESTAL